MWEKFVVLIYVLTASFIGVESLYDPTNTENLQDYDKKQDEESNTMFSSYDSNHWIDPNNMFGEDDEDKDMASVNDNQKLQDCPISDKASASALKKCQQELKEKSQSKVPFFKHLIRYVVDQMIWDGEWLVVRLSLSKERHIHMKTLMEQDENEKDFLDFFKNSFKVLPQRPCPDANDSSVSPYINWLFIIIILVIIGASIYVNFALFATLTWRKYVVIAVVFCFLISIPWEWYRMFKVALAAKSARVMREIPQECNPGNTTWIALKMWFKDAFTFSEDVCLKYHESVLVDPLWEVSPFQAAAVCCSRFILQPMELAGAAVGKTFRLMFQEIPIQWQPFVFVASVFLIVIVIFTVSGFEISTPLLRLGTRPPQPQITLLQNQLETVQQLVHSQEQEIQRLRQADRQDNNPQRLLIRNQPQEGFVVERDREIRMLQNQIIQLRNNNRGFQSRDSYKPETLSLLSSAPNDVPDNANNCEVTDSTVQGVTELDGTNVVSDALQAMRLEDNSDARELPSEENSSRSHRLSSSEPKEHDERTTQDEHTLDRLHSEILATSAFANSDHIAQDTDEDIVTIETQFISENSDGSDFVYVHNQ